MLELAVLGTGRIGQVHAKNLAALPGVCLKYRVDPVAKPAREALALCTGASDVGADEVFADRRTAGVAIANSIDADLLRRTDQPGLSAIATVAAAAGALDLVVMRGCQSRHDPNSRAERERIASAAGALFALPMDQFIPRFETAHRAEIAALVDRIRDGLKPPARIRAGLEAQPLAEAAPVPINAGQRVGLTPDRQP